MAATVKGSVAKRVRCTENPSHIIGYSEDGHVPQCQFCGAPGRLTKSWWHCSPYLVNGKVVYLWKSSGSPVKEIALEQHLAAIDAVNKNVPYVKTSKKRFEEVAEDFLKWCDTQAEDGLEPVTSTVKYYRLKLTKNIVPYFRGMHLDSITREHCLAFLKSRRNAPYITNGKNLKNKKHKTIGVNQLNHERAVLVRFFSWCCSKDDSGQILSVHPCLGMKLPLSKKEKKATKKKPFALTVDQIRQMQEEVVKTRKGKNGKEIPLYPPRLRFIVALGLTTGLRIEGILTLRWSEIDFVQNKITKEVKGQTEVEIPLSPYVLHELEIFRKAIPVHSIEFVIPSPRNPEKPMGITANFGLQKLCKAAGIKNHVTNHIFRHTFATHMLSQTSDIGDINTIAKILGHDPKMLLQLYAHDDYAKMTTLVHKLSENVFKFDKDVGKEKKTK